MQLNRSKEQGLVYLPILIAVVALIGFILVSSSTDLKDKLFSTSVVKEAKAQTTPFVCTACAADVNKDGNVNTRDFSILKACTNKPATGLCAKADINGDGVIDDKDLNCWKSQLGKQCKPSPTPQPFVCTACAADVNKDGNVNTRDFSILKACTNKPATGLCAKADINGDGVIDDKDLNCWKSQHGKQCKP